MAQTRIIDTGWHNLTRSGTQATRVNGGTAINLPTASVQHKEEISVESTMLPSMIPTSAQPIGYAKPALGITVVLRKDNASDQIIYKQLIGTYDALGIGQTPGVKLLFVSATTDVIKSHVELYGSTSLPFHGNEITAGLPAIPGYASNVNSSDIPNSNLVRVGFDFKVA